jgi:hypothetical protein
MSTRPSEEYAAFDALMGELLTVPKAVLKERLDAHKARAAANPNKRGPKPKTTPPSENPSDASRDAAD